MLAQDCFEVVNLVLHCFTSQRHLNDYTVPLQWATNVPLFHLFQSPHSLAPLDPPLALSSWKGIGILLGVSWHRQLTLPFGFIVRTKVNVPVSLVVCLSQSFKFVHASKLADAGFTEEVSSKMLSVNVLALELIASFFKATGVRQKGKQVVSQQGWNHFISAALLVHFWQN